MSVASVVCCVSVVYLSNASVVYVLCMLYVSCIIVWMLCVCVVYVTYILLFMSVVSVVFYAICVVYICVVPFVCMSYVVHSVSIVCAVGVLSVMCDIVENTRLRFMLAEQVLYL